MLPVETTQIINVPRGIKFTVSKRVVTVKGARGELTRAFRHAGLEIMKVGSRKIKVTKYFGTRKEIAAVRTVCSHITNMFTGVMKGYRFKMHSVYAHFPINLAILEKNTRLQIRNFLGEKIERHVDMLPGVTVTSSQVKDEIFVEGNDLEAVSQSCALIKQSVAVKNKDIRKFLDGIYVSHRENIVQDD